MGRGYVLYDLNGFLSDLEDASAFGLRAFLVVVYKTGSDLEVEDLIVVIIESVAVLAFLHRAEGVAGNGREALTEAGINSAAVAHLVVGESPLHAGQILEILKKSVERGALFFRHRGGLVQEAGSVYGLEPCGAIGDAGLFQKIVWLDVGLDVKAGVVAEDEDIEMADPLRWISAGLSLGVLDALEDRAEEFIVIFDRLLRDIGIDTGVVFLMVSVLQMQHVEVRFLVRDQVTRSEGNEGIDTKVVEGLALLHVAEKLRTKSEGGTVMHELETAVQHTLRAGNFREMVADLLARSAGIHHGAGHESFFICALGEGLYLDEFFMCAPGLCVLKRIIDHVIEKAVFRGEHAGGDAGVDRVGI